MSVNFTRISPEGAGDLAIVALHGWGQIIGDSWIEMASFNKMSGLTQFCVDNNIHLVYAASSNRTWYAMNTWRRVLENVKAVNNYVADNLASRGYRVSLAGFSDGGRIAQICLADNPGLYQQAVFHSARFVSSTPFHLGQVHGKEIVTVIGDNDFKFNRHDANLIHYSYIQTNHARKIVVPGMGHTWAKDLNNTIFGV